MKLFSCSITFSSLNTFIHFDSQLIQPEARECDRFCLQQDKRALQKNVLNPPVTNSHSAIMWFQCVPTCTGSPHTEVCAVRRSY